MSSDEEDDVDEESKCPICFDKFKFPKILPCRHTFCRTCLNVYNKQKKSGENDNIFSCPMCREKHNISQDGIRYFLTNYFVKDKAVRMNRYCQECGKKFPSSDFKCGCTRRDVIPTADTACDTDMRRMHMSDFLLPFHLKFQLQTKLEVRQIASMCLADNPDDRGQVTALCPTADDHCWAVMRCQPEMVKLNVLCEIKQIEQFPPTPQSPKVIFDIACRSDGFMLLLSKGQIWKMNPETNLLTLFAEPAVCEDMALFPDDRVVVVGSRGFRNVSFQREMRENELQELNLFGQILIFSEHGKFIRGLGRPEDNLDFNAVAINPIANFICVTDCRQKCVLVMLESGQLIGKFSGNDHGLNFLRIELFTPMGICCLPSGYIIVVEKESGLLYVLSPNGSFRGVVATCSNEPFHNPFGNPFLVACGNSGDILWVGDRETGEVTVFSLTGYDNCLTRSLF